MPQLKNLIISTFAAAVLLLFGGVNEVKGDPLVYSEYAGEVYIEWCKRFAAGDLVIPSTYKGKPVTGIQWGAFQGCNGLTSVMIPDSVEYIMDSAFE